MRTGNGLNPVLDGRKFVVAIAPLERDDAAEEKVPLLPSADRAVAFDQSRSVLMFEGGRVCTGTKSCDFESGGMYRSTISGNAVTFDAETDGGSAGRVFWRGTVRGAELFGTASRTTADGGRLDYTFYGQNDE